MHVWFFGLKGAPWRNCRLKECKTSFSPLCVFLYSRYSLKNGGERCFGFCGSGGLVTRVLFSGSMSVEMFNVGCWLTHGDMVLETRVDFLTVVEHRLVPARVRGEWAGLRAKGASSVWSPASQESSHVGRGGVGVISLRGCSAFVAYLCHCSVQAFF